MEAYWLVLVAGLAVLWVITTAVAVLLPQNRHLVTKIPGQADTDNELVAHRCGVDRLHVWQITLLIFTCLWGFDYLIGPTKSSMHVVERTMPLALWGSLLLFFGIMGLLGEMWMEAGRNPTKKQLFPILCSAENRWWPSFTAHTMLCAMCAGMGVGAAAEMVINGHFWGIRVPGFLFLLMVAHWVFAQKRRHAP